MKFKDNAIKHRMLECGLRLNDLAERTGITRPTLSAIANGKTCRQDTAEKICVALDCKITDLAKEV